MFTAKIFKNDLLMAQGDNFATQEDALEWANSNYDESFTKEYSESFIDYVSMLSDKAIELRRALYSDEIEKNALGGVYDAPSCSVPKVINGVTLTREKAQNTANAFRAEFYRVKTLIDLATTNGDKKLAFEQANFPITISNL